MNVCMPALGLAVFTMHAEKFVTDCKSTSHRLADHIRIFMSSEVRFKVLDLIAGKCLSK